MFIKTRGAGSIRWCLQKPELLGAVGDGDLFTKSLLPPEQLTRATTLPEMGRA